MGETYRISPQVVVIAPNQIIHLGTLSGEDVAKRKNYSPIFKSVSAYFENGTTPAQAKVLHWHSKSKPGVYRNGQMAGVSDTHFYLKYGEHFHPSPFSNFQPGSVAFAKLYAKTLPEFEIPKNTKGKKKNKDKKKKK